MDEHYNDSFNEAGEKAEFIYKPNPIVPHSWQIFRYKTEKNEYEPVGDYTLVNTEEASDITEKKLINMIGLLNGKKELLQLGNLTGTRVLYNIVQKATDTQPTKILFRDYDGESVSVDNAVLTIEKGVFDDGYS